MYSRVRAHQIPHQWETKRRKNPSKTKCIICSNTFGFFVQYEKCRSCKMAIHIECKKNFRVQDNCGLTQKHLKELVTQMVISKTQENWAPEIGNTRSMSDIFVNDDPNSADEQLNSKKDRFERRSWNMFSIRRNAAWKDDTIPMGELKVISQIGIGRFGEVYEAYYYEPAVIKFFDMFHVDEQKRLETFKQDTACFQNVRHENLVFFRGFYTMELFRFGIVMELIGGHTLSHILHEEPTPDMHGSSLEFNEIMEYARQICQGMSYLHTKHILHKDLRSKNVFVNERRTVKITDFGVFNLKRLSFPARRDSFLVPSNWLSYAPPELVRILSHAFEPFQFTEACDVYSFGTIWFELLTNAFPFSNVSSDLVIWQVGNGIRTSISELSASHEAKALLIRCWSFNPLERTSFAELLQLLKNMPRKALKRSPSFPPCKSFESIF
ncbi:hypothetical protein niasHT_023595 [Heterodera trifolii]|uniref:Uncharacterized protein n=1 Tax=Heterodera trifolii TaxID=157864 RepID=A0ABD2JK52_9BILA